MQPALAEPPDRRPSTYETPMTSAQFAYLLIGFAGFGLLAAGCWPDRWMPRGSLHSERQDSDPRRAAPAVMADADPVVSDPEELSRYAIRTYRYLRLAIVIVLL